MIDRNARNQAALLVRRFAGGRATWDEFENALSETDFDAQDTVFIALAEAGTYWDKHTPQRELAMWVLFLKTGNEYQWPAENMPDGVLFFLTFFAGVMSFLVWGSGYVLAGTRLIALTAVVSTAWAEYKTWSKRRKGDKSAHPFFHTYELQQVRQFPRFLNGALSS